MIKPTVGRKIWVRNRPESISYGQPEDGTIVYVHTETCINVAGLNAVGSPFTLTSLYLHQGEQPAPTDMAYAEWMPYQAKQAEKQAAEEKLQETASTAEREAQSL